MMWCQGWRRIGLYGWLLASLFGAGSAVATSEQPTLTLLTELWPPYVMRGDNGELAGADLDLACTVLRQMGYRTEIRVLPWKRVLQQARLRQGDAVVDVFFEPSRQHWLHYPEEPLSYSGEVLFYPTVRPVDFKQLSDLKGLRIGIQEDYAYSPDFLTDPGVIRMPMTGEGNAIKQLHLMMAGRLDGVVLNERVGRYLLHTQGLQDQVNHGSRLLTDDNRNFLAFTHKPGHDQLAIRFSSALKAFKQTPAYKQLLARYHL
ncbi:transporter substrate-binding domain-containing protein [Aeromonas veronii]|uniref:substrate-binding periplasmic protein n=1 Tax=Aeromonas veronii TaxID=654 RepID=UPI001FD63B2A|nr:transporter substrate-binding domain-containing protein [Aeromonas veronii]MCJ7974802.1 transporter substrate-binding domain-containing protein [Aeromonas veronii]UOR18867.1 transporter substrate-binding domain-containing protein [Aeromonas veronii]